MQYATQSKRCRQVKNGISGEDHEKTRLKPANYLSDFASLRFRDAVFSLLIVCLVGNYPIVTVARPQTYFSKNHQLKRVAFGTIFHRRAA
jgi:hypothetical protein